MAIAFRDKATATGSNTTSATITIPAATTTGDIMYAFLVYSANMNPPSDPGAVTWPSGWAGIDQAPRSNGGGGNLGVRMAVGYRRWQAGDSNATITIVGTQNTATGYVCTVVAYSGVDASGNGLVTSSIKTTGTSTSSAAQTTNSVSSSASGVWRLASHFGVHTFDTWTWGSESPADTERADTYQNNGTFIPALVVTDSNTSIDASGGTTLAATPSATIFDPISWIGLISPPLAVTANADAASATATAYDATVVNTVTTEVDTAAPTPTAYDATVGLVLQVSAASASAVAVAYNATVGLGLGAGATAAATAYDTTVGLVLQVEAGTVSLAVTANDAVTGTVTNADTAAVSSTASDTTETLILGVGANQAAAVGTASDTAIATESFTDTVGVAATAYDAIAEGVGVDDLQVYAGVAYA